MGGPSWRATPAIAEPPGLYAISVTSELSGFTAGTLRLYEQYGLITPARTRGGTRRYNDEDLTRSGPHHRTHTPTASTSSASNESSNSKTSTALLRRDNTRLRADNAHLRRKNTHDTEKRP